MTDNETPINQETLDMAFQDQNQKAAANPVYPARYQQFLELEERVKELERKYAEDATSKD